VDALDKGADPYDVLWVVSRQWDALLTAHRVDTTFACRCARGVMHYIRSEKDDSLPDVVLLATEA